LILKQGQWLKTAFVPEETADNTAPSPTISIDQLRKTSEVTAPIVTIKRDQLRAAYIDSKAEKDSDLMQRMPRSGCGYAKTLMPKDKSALGLQAFVAWPASPGVISRAVEHLNRRHPVRLVWTEGAAESEVVLMINDCEYASFLANLRRFAGQRWQEVGYQLK